MPFPPEWIGGSAGCHGSAETANVTTPVEVQLNRTGFPRGSNS